MRQVLRPLEFAATLLEMTSTQSRFVYSKQKRNLLTAGKGTGTTMHQARCDPCVRACLREDGRAVAMIEIADQLDLSFPDGMQACRFGPLRSGVHVSGGCS